MRISIKFGPMVLAVCLAAAVCLLPAGTAPAQRGIPVTSTPKDASRRIALVIGNGAYKEAPLRNPANDARDLASALKGMGFEVTQLSDLRQSQMKRAIDQFGREIRRGGVGFFFFAGHGAQVNGRNYLFPIGAVINGEADVEYECVDAGRVLAKMETANNHMNIMALDACRNNPYAAGFRSGNKGLASMNAPRGTIIAYAASPGQRAADGKGRNSPFTASLLKNIATPGLDAVDCLQNVQVEVVKRTGGRQSPWLGLSPIEGKFYFKPGMAAEAVQVAGGPVPESAPGAARPRVQPAPKPKPEPAGLRPAGTADLYVTTDPGEAMVYLDGVQKGRSPQTLEMIPAGKHVINARKGYQVGQDEITLMRDDLKKVHVKLEHQKGDVKLFSDPPGAEVRLDGKLVCKATPCKVAGVKAGVHQLEVLLWKGNKCWDYRSEVEVKPGGNRLSLELKRNRKAEREKLEAQEKARIEAERKRRAQEKTRAKAEALKLDGRSLKLIFIVTQVSSGSKGKVATFASGVSIVLYKTSRYPHCLFPLGETGSGGRLEVTVPKDAYYGSKVGFYTPAGDAKVEVFAPSKPVNGVVNIDARLEISAEGYSGFLDKLAEGFVTVKNDYTVKQKGAKSHISGALMAQFFKDEERRLYLKVLGRSDRNGRLNAIVTLPEGEIYVFKNGYAPKKFILKDGQRHILVELTPEK